MNRCVMMMCMMMTNSGHPMTGALCRSFQPGEIRAFFVRKELPCTMKRLPFTAV